MASVNKVIIVGNMTKEPEMTFTPGGVAVTKFSLAVNESWTSNGEKKEHVEFFNCEAWNKAAEAINQYVTKGQPLYVEGKLRTETWDDRDTGAKKSRVKVVVSEFQFLASKPRDEDNTPAQRPAANARKQVIEEDDLPF